MTIYHKPTNRETFIKFLHENNVNKNIISRFENLPEIIKNNNIEYQLTTNLTWNDEGKTHYDFELNYYSKDNMEFLFNYKIFNDVEISINYLERMIKKM